MAVESRIVESPHNHAPSPTPTPHGEHEARQASAQNAVLESLGVLRKAFDAEGTPKHPDELGVGVVAVTIQSLVVWPLDSLRLHMSVWQTPSWFALVFRTHHGKPHGPPLLVPSSVRPAVYAGLLESTLWPTICFASHYLEPRPKPRVVAPGGFQPVVPTSPPPRLTEHPAARLLGPRVGRYLAYPLRQVALLRQIGAPGPSLTLRSWAAMVFTPWRSRQLGAARGPDFAWRLAHEVLDSAEWLAVEGVRGVMMRARRPLPRGVTGPPGTATLLLETWVPTLVGKLVTHVPRAALLRAQVGLPRVAGWGLLAAGTEPFVLAEIVLDWYLIEAAAWAVEWVRRTVTAPTQPRPRAGEGYR
ncbi:hypothetical protein H9P43_005057 [Blastocladiella emersonii ATCC 22665]|nr:hypothetical protein H9P43_005057 [Blastocladiella emersonii ATCC 22665]